MEKPVRQDKFQVGDRLFWNTPVCMDHCYTWYPPSDVEYTCIEVRDIESPHGMRGAGHTQMVRVKPNYNKWGDEFSGVWFYPIDRETGNSIDHNGRVCQPVKAEKENGQGNSIQDNISD